MCDHDNQRLIDLFESVRRIKPLPESTDQEQSWYRGTLHGIKLAIQQVPPEFKQAA